MKTLKLLIGIFILVMAAGCNDTDEKTSGDNLKGKWSLVNVSGDLVNNSFGNGQITWDFNPATHTVHVVNSVFAAPSGFQSGTYQYAATVNPNAEICEKSITVDNANMGCLTFEGNTMYFDLSHVDGAKYKFVR